jgi:hypothetical protein
MLRIMMLLLMILAFEFLHLSFEVSFVLLWRMIRVAEGGKGLKSG